MQMKAHMTDEAGNILEWRNGAWHPRTGSGSQPLADGQKISVPLHLMDSVQQAVIGDAEMANARQTLNRYNDQVDDRYRAIADHFSDRQAPATPEAAYALMVADMHAQSRGAQR